MRRYYAAASPEITRSELDHMALSKRLAGECVVLLENDGTLPLKEKGAIALFGGGARRTVKGGTGSGDVNSRTVVTIEQGLKEAGYRVGGEAWLDRHDRKIEEAKAAYMEFVKKKSAETGMSEGMVTFYDPFIEPAPDAVTEEDVRMAGADTAVYVIARNSGEGSDRYAREGDYLPFAQELESLRVLGRCCRQVILVLNIGGVMELTEIRKIPGISAILLMSQLGNTGGHVLADVISGTVTPSGKLTDTWAERYSDYPSSAAFSHNDGNVDDEFYNEGIYVGYRYFDTFGVKPLYCFGYGKSYTAFALSDEQVSVKDGKVTVSVKVTNTGATYSGKEVVQVYYSAPAGKLDKPYQELAAFVKTSLLKPGQSETVSAAFDVKDMASYCEQCASWVLEAGAYVIRVGTSSRDTKAAAEIVLDRTVKTAVLKNVFALDAEMDVLRAPKAAGNSENSAGNSAVSIPLSADSIETETASYQGERKLFTTDKTEKLTMADVLSGRCTVEELTAQLSVEELAVLCVGTERREEGSIVGSASNVVPGAAGDSAALLAENRGIKGMIMADGPAGLRLQPHFKTTKDGELIPGGNILGDVAVPFPEDLEESQTVDYYQYCTAIPIGWALAQAWNSRLLEEIGSMVGEEMEQFHVDLWLAPAMNIHRNPLCGRNFEYYSEDPVVAGKAAAAITKGVQSHAGKGTTIKHFAANSQEDNRYFSNAHITERTMREIYLKGFEIAVKESQPMSIMTSYNLINGIHTANSYELLQTVARDEWGFEGVVMTDWYTSQDFKEMTGGENTVYPISASTGCVCAGNDIQMPGCQKNVDDLVESVKENKRIDSYQVTLADLQFNAANVIRAAAKTTVK